MLLEIAGALVVYLSVTAGFWGVTDAFKSEEPTKFVVGLVWPLVLAIVPPGLLWWACYVVGKGVRDAWILRTEAIGCRRRIAELELKQLQDEVAALEAGPDPLEEAFEALALSRRGAPPRQEPGRHPMAWRWPDDPA